MAIEKVDVAAIFNGSNGDLTKQLYAELEKLGPRGLIALNLFRACKASVRAKIYRRKFKSVSYEKKNWSLQNLTRVLNDYPDIRSWGWLEDPEQEYHNWVLYVDLPTGQVSFHAREPTREIPKAGFPVPSLRLYLGEWDGYHVSAKRIIAYADHVLNGTEAAPVLQPCRRCAQGITAYPGGKGSDLCAACAGQPATPGEIRTLTQADFVLA